MSSSPQVTNGVQSSFAEHHTEIKRRATVNEAGQFDESTFERAKSDAVDDPYMNTEQIFLVFSLSQKEFAPLPRDPSNPGICIFGAFETYDEAMEHATLVRAEHPTYSVMIDKTHNWIGAFATVKRMLDQVYASTKKTELLDAMHAERVEAHKEFETNVKNHCTGTTKAPTDEKDNVEVSNGQRPDRIHRGCRVEGQSLAVVSFVKDSSADAEFLVKVYALYDTEDNANRYVRNVCGDRVKDCDIDVIKTCAWAFPQSMQGKHVRQEIYRSSELHNVMLAHKQAPQDVERFRSEHKEYFTDPTSPPPTEASVAVDASATRCE